jgi:hypothetical protein
MWRIPWLVMIHTIFIVKYQASNNLKNILQSLFYFLNLLFLQQFRQLKIKNYICGYNIFVCLYPVEICVFNLI